MSQTGTSELADPLLGRIEAALRQQFPTDTVDVTAGYANNIHIPHARASRWKCRCGRHFGALA